MSPAQRFEQEIKSAQVARLLRVILIGGDGRTYRCRITIAGELSQADREDLADFGIEFDGTNTVLVGDLAEASPRGRPGDVAHTPAWRKLAAVASTWIVSRLHSDGQRL